MQSPVKQQDISGKGTPTQKPLEKPPWQRLKNIQVFELYRNISDMITQWCDRLWQNSILVWRTELVSFQKLAASGYREVDFFFFLESGATRQNKMTINGDH